MTNPYALQGVRSGEAPVGSTRFRHPAYTVPSPPDSSDPEYGEENSPQLNYSTGVGTPDAVRIGLVEEPENDPNIRSYQRQRTDEFFKRHADEHTETSWDTQQHTVAPAQNPLWEQERLHTRPSAVRAPMGYLFTRPWHIPRNIQDEISEDAVTHISMADHRRVYEIYGMRPGDRVGVNTFRYDPAPWDQNVYAVDQIASPQQYGGGLFSGSGSFRLG